MADSYHSEEEQVEALKRWWQENGKSTVISIVVAIAAVMGWQGYQKQQQSALEAASSIYQNLLLASSGENGVVTPEQTATANHLADTLKQDFSSSTYASFAALYKAKLAVGKGDLKAAESELRWVLEQSDLPEIDMQATLRLARVLAAQESFDEALALLEKADAVSAEAEEVRGDVFYARGDLESANLAYQKSQELFLGIGAQPNSLLRMKIQQLKSEMEVITADSSTSETPEEPEPSAVNEGV